MPAYCVMGRPEPVSNPMWIFHDRQIALGNCGDAPGRQIPYRFRRGYRHCFYYGRTNHVSERCWDKCGQPTWAQIVDASPSDSPTTDCSTSGTRVLIPHSKYEFFYFQATQTASQVHSATHATVFVLDTSVF